jgi:DNA repair protein RadC
METIVREAKVTWTPSKVKQSALPVVNDAVSAVQVVRNFYDDVINVQERFAVILLNQANRVLGVRIVSTGGVSGTVADPKIIFHTALLSLASAIIIVHNHPSGNLKPSESDKLLTKKIADGATMLEIRLLDHLIITEDGFYSFADNEQL